MKLVLSTPVKYFTDRSKVVLLLWIICVMTSDSFNEGLPTKMTREKFQRK